jgi:hypothetical protein
MKRVGLPHGNGAVTKAQSFATAATFNHFPEGTVQLSVFARTARHPSAKSATEVLNSSDLAAARQNGADIASVLNLRQVCCHAKADFIVLVKQLKMDSEDAGGVMR